MTERCDSSAEVVRCHGHPWLEPEMLPSKPTRVGHHVPTRLAAIERTSAPPATALTDISSLTTSLPTEPKQADKRRLPSSQLLSLDLLSHLRGRHLRSWLPRRASPRVRRHIRNEESATSV